MRIVYMNTIRYTTLVLLLYTTEYTIQITNSSLHDDDQEHHGEYHGEP